MTALHAGPAELLHSRYNPHAEAERYIESLGLNGNIRFFILIEPGLGYLAQELKKRRAGCKIVSLHADSRLRQYCGESAAWYPDSPETIQNFLEREIPETLSSSIRIIEWRPGLRQYGRLYLEILSEAADFIKRADASFRTTRNFGRRWVHNFFKNLGFIRKITLYRPSNSALIVTGSGPSLEETLPRIRELADRAFVLAASSSVPALREGGIVADLLISTDGGGWAQNHLYSCFRITDKTPLAVNLCAALPSQSSEYPFLVLNDGSLWQTLVLSGLGIPSVIVPQRGTVTASALELALELSHGPVYLAGMDLSVRDIQSHARPYGFDWLFYGSASRLRPLYSRYFVRSRDIIGGGSLEVYAAWFRDRLKNWPQRIFALDRNAVFRAAPARIDSAPRGNFLGIAPPEGDPAEYRERALAVLFRALDDPAFGETLLAELGALLFSGVCPGKEQLIQELKNFAVYPGERDRG
jgi:hypothetical protein